MKKLSFLQRLFRKPVPKPPVARDCLYFEAYMDVLIQHNEALNKLVEINQQVLTLSESLHKAEVENTTLRLILSGDYTVARRPESIE